MGALLPWLFFGVGCASLLYAIAIGVAETGDPPYVNNDHLQQSAIVASPVLFNLAIVWAAVARRKVTALLMTIAGAGFCLLGWWILHWDIPTLFQ